MKLTQSCEMGIHAAWFIAIHAVEKPLQSVAIASGIRASESYLVKVLQRLAHARVLVSRKGKAGGYTLARRPLDITLADIVRVCDGDDSMYGCMRDERGCAGDKAQCPICRSVERARQVLYQELSKTTVQDLVDFGWPELSPLAPRAPVHSPEDRTENSPKT